MNYAFFAKTMKNVKKNRNIKFVTKERKRNYLVSEPDYHATKSSTENVIGTEMRAAQILMNKPVC